jgi:hypothetical protein
MLAAATRMYSVLKGQETRGNPQVQLDPMNFMIFHEFPPADLEKAWRDGLTRVEAPSHYDAPEFFREPIWEGKSAFAVLALDDGAVAGVLTGIHEGDQISGGLPSRPQIWVDSTKNADTALDALARGLLMEAGPAKLLSVYTWPSLPLDAFHRYGFRLRQLQGNVVLDLTQGPEALFKQFSHQRRKNIRGAIKYGVEVTQATTSEDVREAYDVYYNWYHKTTRKKLHGVETPFAVFARMHQLTGNRRLFVARHSGKIVACTAFRFYPHGLLEASENFSLEEFLHLRANDLVCWRAIEWACSEGFPCHSLGGSHRFHRNAGGSIVPVLRYRLDRTWLRRHDFGEAVRDRGREAVRKLPPKLETIVRQCVGREIPEGW